MIHFCSIQTLVKEPENAEDEDNHAVQVAGDDIPKVEDEGRFSLMFWIRFGSGPIYICNFAGSGEQKNSHE